MLRPLLVAGFALAGAAPLAAQGIEGTWITEFERSVRNENGAVSGGEKAKAKMVPVLGVAREELSVSR